MVGTKAPPWRPTGWVNSRPPALPDLAGKVVLVRWWTAPGCPLCAATAPALNASHARYPDRGLVVIGVYHHKANTRLEPEKVRQAAAGLGFRFPVAVGPNWQAALASRGVR